MAAEFIAEPGDLLFKPRGPWHTFWKTTATTPRRSCEDILPPASRHFFPWLAGQPDHEPPSEEAGETARPYECDVDIGQQSADGAPEGR